MTGRTGDRIAAGPDGRPLAEQPPWRRDFPVDTAEENYVARRDFTKFLVLTSAAFVTGQFAILFGELSRRNRPAPGAVAILPAANLPVGGAKAFAYPGEHDTCLLVRVDETKFVAFSQECTHLSCAVIPQPEQKRFFCPCHDGSFDLETGRPIAGPPQRPLPRVNLEIRDGVVYATGIELRTL